jgi:tRNA threonylcarbamoyladenosine biosynthesis protein TsaB
LNLLGLDTSTAVSAVCVLRADGVAFEAQPSREAFGGRPLHGRDLLPAVAEALGASGLDWGELDAVGVGVGPGGFTGLRIGVSTARALAASRALELRPVSSLAALAHGIDDAWRLPVIDARRGEVYAALYEGDSQRLAPFAAAAETVVERVLETGADPLAAGDGAVRFRDVLQTGGVRVAAAGSGAHLVGGLSVCRLAAAASASPAEAVLPDYLRSPDAKPQ